VEVLGAEEGDEEEEGNEGRRDAAVGFVELIPLALEESTRRRYKKKEKS
jgi:hypothetical protein